jgi:hypothetical protein
MSSCVRNSYARFAFDGEGCDSKQHSSMYLLSESFTLNLTNILFCTVELATYLQYYDKLYFLVLECAVCHSISHLNKQHGRL